MIKSFFKRVQKNFLDLVFPIFCLSCNKEGDWLCQECLNKWAPSVQFFCPACYKDNDTGHTCVACKDKTFLDGAVSLSSYDDKIIADVIKKIKYDFIENLSSVIIELVKKQKQYNLGGYLKDSLLIPVPLHRERFLERGFNQAEIFAKILKNEFSCKIENGILKRSKNIKAQAKLGALERKKNVQNAFILTGKQEGGRVILIDDVFTTGSTLNECAKVLKAGGIKEVWGLTLAREK